MAVARVNAVELQRRWLIGRRRTNEKPERSEIYETNNDWIKAFIRRLHVLARDSGVPFF